MLGRAKTMSGKISLKRELDDVREKGDKTLCEDVFAIGVDVAAADGSIGPQEKVVLVDLAKRLGISNVAEYGL